VADYAVVTGSGGLQFTWPVWALLIELSHYRETARGALCEMTVVMTTSDKPKRLTAGVLSLTTFSSRDSLALKLKKLYEAPDWARIIETVCVRGAEEFRKGDPAIVLTGEGAETTEAFILNPLLYARHPTLLYGPGDSGKSFLALYLACLLTGGGSENGFACSDHNVLYLDWELAAEDMNQRLALLKAGHYAFRSVQLAYKRVVTPLADCLTELQSLVQRHDSDVIVVDSLALAAGGELERAETAIRFYQALRHLNKPALLLGHVAKNAEEKTPFGSVFFFNLARSIWEVRKVQEPESGHYVMGLYHRKCNLGPRRLPIGLQVTIGHDRCMLSTADLSEEPELRAAMPLVEQVTALLKDKRARTAQLITEELDAPLETVRRTLQRHKGSKWYQLTGSGGKEAQWACL